MENTLVIFSDMRDSVYLTAPLNFCVSDFLFTAQINYYNMFGLAHVWYYYWFDIIYTIDFVVPFSQFQICFQ